MSLLGEGGMVKTAVVERAAYDLISARETGQCADCIGCIRHCPARAIRSVDGVREIIAERCVACGACVAECRSPGFVVRDDLPAVRALLASDQRVVVILASEYVAALHPLQPAEVERNLLALGFSAVETTVLGEEIVAAAYERVHSSAGDAFPRLRSTCPVVVSWVERYYPQLTHALAPVAPPYIAQARLVRKIYPDDTAIVYVSPCWARKDEVRDPQFEGVVDVAIGFDELLSLIAENSATFSVEQPDSGRYIRRPQPVKELSLIDGFPRRTLIERNMTDGGMVTVRGLADIDRMLQAIVRGEIAPHVVDMLNCEGCIDGPAVNPNMSVFAKRNLISAERERQPPPVVGSRTFLSALPPIELRRSFTARPVITRAPTSDEVDEMLAAGEFESRAETIDCGACGFDTCVELAAAICLGDATWERCFPLQRKRMQREHDELSDFALLDPLTSLGNRRAFDARLAEEVSRATRYGTSVSLAMVDLDGFKQINDRFGHVAGDTVLVRIGALLREVMRASDVSTRYGGDEFAIILPDTGKTEAWLAAEKLRAAFADARIELAEGSVVCATGSVGVATHGEKNSTAGALLEAADAALYQAKHRGRNRVELAAG